MFDIDAFKDKYKKAEAYPCPFCGNDKLRVGNTSCMTWAVVCSCGVSMSVDMPDKYSKEEKEELKNLEKILSLNWDEAMHYLHSLQAIQKWNRRK